MKVFRASILFGASVGVAGAAWKGAAAIWGTEPIASVAILASCFYAIVCAWEDGL